ncbi:SDR family NAD(P)-dependent oxidoreductase [Nonomuraea zeae]|uniref:Probable oxidoreductase n=1 Tax=Nonomuraea zeae TaxID=1642303 RepID=A0A5S4FZK9_9ACTN|nr:SDR family NAD(P)-dependent oxidoreductase [Nonomuraea zeae]TMR26138.1 SDR family NAD(P)-dependent oxidoreductase [Nonomuraea zeae]
MNTERVTTPFGPATTAEEIVEGVDLSAKRAIVTGASAGIGVETARALAKAGADVTLAVRDTAAGEKAAAGIVESTGSARVRVAYLDLSVRGSIDAFVAAWRDPLDILVDNAGIMATPERRTAEGWELQFATNHLGHFALTTGLHGALAAAGRARVVVVSSVGHVNGDVIWDDLHFEHHPYDAWRAYSQSKTANILFAVEAARRWAADGIAVNALNPGRIWSTCLARHMSAPPAAFEPGSSDGVTVKDIPQGAATSTLLAASPLVEGVTGRYFEDCQEAASHTPGLRRGFAAYAVAPEAAARLWRVSLDLLG